MPFLKEPNVKKILSCSILITVYYFNRQGFSKETFNLTKSLSKWLPKCIIKRLQLRHSNCRWLQMWHLGLTADKAKQMTSADETCSRFSARACMYGQNIEIWRLWNSQAATYTSIAQCTYSTVQVARRHRKIPIQMDYASKTVLESK